MKKLISLVLSVVMLLTSVPVLAQDGNALDFLTSWGLLTEEEVGWLMRPSLSEDSGEELVRTITFDIPEIASDSPAEQAVLEILRKTAIQLYQQPGEGKLTLNIDGADFLSLALGERDGELRLALGMEDAQPVAVRVDEVTELLVRLAQEVNSQKLLGESTKELHLGDWAIALQHGYITPWWLNDGWQLLINFTPADLESLDLTEWYATIEAIEARKVTEPVTEQPEGLEASQVWSLTVDVMDLLNIGRAALVTIRDNPLLCDFLADQFGYDAMKDMMDAERGSFRDEAIIPLIEMLDEAKLSLQDDSAAAWSLALMGWEDEAGTLLRVEGVFIDEADAEHPMMMNYDRTALEAGTAHRIEFTDGVGGMGLTLLEGDGSWQLDVESRSDGEWSKMLTYALGLDVTRSEAGTAVKAHFSSEMPDVVASSLGPVKTTSSAVTLALLLSAEMTEAHLTMSTNVMGPDVAIEAYEAFTDAPADESGLCGVETVVVQIADEEQSVMLGVNSQVRRQSASGSIFGGEALYLNDLTDEEFSAWVSEKAREVEAWGMVMVMAIGAQAMEMNPELPENAQEMLEQSGVME